MEGREYRFIIEDQSGYFSGTGNGIKTSAPDTIATSASGNIEREGLDGFSSKIASQSIRQLAISPLNQITGGLASPAYSLGRSIANGAGAGAIGGGVAMASMAVLQFAMNKIQERLAKMEAKASAANERDNMLIRTGRKSYSTSYTSSFSGVKATVDRN